MTLRRWTIAALAVMIACLVALGGNSLWAISQIEQEGRQVEVEVSRANDLIDFIIAARSVSASMDRYYLSESDLEHDTLDNAIHAFETLLGKGTNGRPQDAPAFAPYTGEALSYVSKVRTASRMEDIRVKDAANANEAVTDLIVDTTALVEKTRGNADAASAATKMLGGVEASAIATLRYRMSREPADALAATRFFELGQIAFEKLQAMHDLDPKVVRLVSTARDPMRQFKNALAGLDSKTENFEEAATSARTAGTDLMNKMLAARALSGSNQDSAVARVITTVLSAKTVGLAALALVIAWGLLTALGLFAYVVKPLVMITDAMRSIAAGTLDGTIPYARRGDEIGAMARSLAIFRQGLLDLREIGVRQGEDQAKKQRSIETLTRATGVFRDDMSELTTGLTDSATVMKEAARDLLAISAQTNTRSTAVSSAAAEASASVRQVAVSTEEIAASIVEMEQRLVTSKAMAEQAVAQASEADANVQALVTDAARIGDVVGLIHSIAQETNLLALNATIEAARAGEAGRGFAVVAAEVKQLAVATGKATGDIRRQVEQIQETMQRAAQAIGDIRGSILAIEGNAVESATAMEAQTSAIRLITIGADRAAAGADNVTENMLGVGTASASTDAAARRVLAAAESLAQRAETVTVKVNDFLVAAR